MERAEEDGPPESPTSLIQEPDIMNDPKFNTNSKRKEKDGEDVDTCRICRGEGSHEEALFYPCKCSGSIKFVHQNCLMEWLAHSQKKHCELCKTPFRFTKLYHPHMPTRVPIPVFLRQAALHSWTTFQTWIRLQLVFFVWVFWLPWCMRTIWRGLFWVGDGAWVDWSEREIHQTLEGLTSKTDSPWNGTLSGHVRSFGSKQVTASAFMEYVGKKATQMLNSPSWRKEPISLSLAKRLYRFLIRDLSTGDLAPEGSANTTSIVRAMPRSSTWLSDQEFLRTMTRSTTINNIIIDTLEGQLITLFIVVAFILIFLIREWVMQQQQNMLLGPGDDDDAVEGPNVEAPAQQQLGQGPLEHDLGEAGAADNGPRPRLFPRPRRRLNRPQPVAVDQQRDVPQGQSGAGDPDVNEPATLGAESSNASVARMPDPSTASQPLLFPKRNKEGKLVHPPVELEDLLRESSIFRDVLQRVRDDPKLNIMTIIKTEIPTFEVDNLLQRLSAPEITSYLKALHTTPPTTPSRAVDEEIDGIVDSDVAKEGETMDVDTEIESLKKLKAELQQRATSQEAPSASQSAKEYTAIHRLSSGDPDDLSAASPEESKTIDDQSGLGMAVEPSLPQSSWGDTSPTWAFDDVVEDGSDVQYTPQESLDEPSQPGQPSGDDHLINDARMIEQLNSDKLAPSEAESNRAERDSFTSETEEPPNEVAGDHTEASIQDRGYVEAVKNWLWGDVLLPAEAAEQQQAEDDERVVNNLADEAPFVPVGHGHDMVHPADEAENAAQDPEVLAAAAQAGIDPNGAEGVDEVEDLEGIMELIGMEGPLAGLMQNGMFCAVLVSLTIFFGVWIPYMCGKVFLTILARPVTLSLGSLRLTSTGADMVVDVIVLLAGGALYWTDVSVFFLCQPVAWVVPALRPYLDNKLVAQASASYAQHAFDRIVRVSLAAGESFGGGVDVPTFSVIAHESLQQIESQLSAFTKIIIDFQASLMDIAIRSPSFLEALRVLSASIITGAKAIVSYVVQTVLLIVATAPSLLHINPLEFKVAGSYRAAPLDFDLAAWNSTDRAIAVIAGYTFFALIGVLYLYVAGALRGTNKKGAVNGSLAQVLYQAGGVMKVILIISIEMIVFPLYCGLLLDVALLPLFGNVTLMSRAEFTTTSPWTSVFVHWFVGTCYMFHFALFVSMCRRIMRTGVLYFIRDPDDPTFHPVRDVLERSVSNQLWKISFSALVYGGLVLVCLGGVVWGITYTLPGVFPIHWSSDEPVLEFPVDLLFYNFLMPMAVRLFKPSIGLNKVYGWWFRKCARALRLSSFLFNDTRSDEEGKHVRRTWTDVFHGEQGDIRNPVIGEDRQVLAEDRDVRAIFLRNGRYVRTPGSDQVRIPKGATTFIEVDENDKRLDGIMDGDEDPHGRKMNLFMKVYIPPFFRTRVASFVGLIWLFAAFTGVSVTVVPLLFGRWVFARLTPNHLRMNDIYAFSIGIYILGSALWALLNHRRMKDKLYASLSLHTANVASVGHKLKVFTVRVLGLFYAYFALGIILPCLFSLLLEVYLIIPLHTYLQNKNNITPSDAPMPEVLTAAPVPVIHIIQDWTLGVLYVKMFARLILWTAPSRPALALRAVVAKGWLDPDIRLATRAFIFPATLVMVITLVMPLTLGWAASNTFLYSYAKGDEYIRASIYRYSYPAMLTVGLAVVALWLASKAFEGWRRKIRDEVYLIGERLHNFGEGARTGAMSRVRAGKLAVGRAPG